MILAGAGTGKTRVITFRIAHLIAKGVPPDKILAVTFTNKAAKEMRERLGQMRLRAAKGDPQPTICTFHSLGARLLRQHAERLGYKRNFVIYNESEQISALKKVMSQLSSKAKLPDPAEVAPLISRHKNGAAWTALARHGTISALAKSLLGKYQSALRACNAMDFDDLLALSLQLLREHEDVLADCRGRFQYVMVDEYQDTNAAQFELVRLLTARHQNLCVVGDDDQSIYGWRGAEISNLLDMEKHFPKVKVVKLEQNYRSTNTILQAANAVIRHNAQRRAKQLWSQKGEGRRIVLRVFPSDEEEAQAVARRIEVARVGHRVPWGRHAVLFRTNQQARALETALRAARIRYHLIGGQSYFDRREVKDFLAYLKLFVNPHDDISLLRVANVPARGLSDATMERLLAESHASHGSVFSAMRLAQERGLFQTRTRDCLAAFMRLVESERAKLHSTPVPGFSLRAWAEGWLQDIGYWDDLRRGEKDAEAAEHRVRNLKDLISMLDGPELEGETPASRLISFLEQVSLDREREEDEEAGDAVTLITMHSCKGLEFPHVFIVGLEHGLLPHTRSIEENTLEEERRLFYVAITRAQQTLDISYCLARMKYGQLAPSHPSAFLQELPEALVDREDAKSKKPLSPQEARQWFAQMKGGLEPSSPGTAG